MKIKENHCTCSPDSILGVSISDLCLNHDYVYAEHCCWYHKLGGDLMLGLRILCRGIKHTAAGIALITVSPIYTFAVLTFGGIVWRRRNGK